MTHHTQRFALLAAALAAAVIAAPAAQAFTYERNAPGDSGAAMNYTDPMENLMPQQGDSSHFDGNGQTTFQAGGLTVHQFNGSGSFDQRYNPSNLLDPFAREGR
jgi:hypothetical protein